MKQLLFPTLAALLMASPPALAMNIDMSSLTPALIFPEPAPEPAPAPSPDTVTQDAGGMLGQ